MVSTGLEKQKAAWRTGRLSELRRGQFGGEALGGVPEDEVQEGGTTLVGIDRPLGSQRLCQRRLGVR